MKTIYLTKEEFDNFINKKYLLISKTDSGKTVKKDFAFELKANYQSGNPVFLSNINKIYLPDKQMLPLLKTLYGIPAGLLDIHSFKAKKSNKVSSAPVELSFEDIKFTALRRGLLFAHVWSIKSFDMESVRIGMKYLLSADKLTLIKSWLNEIAKAGKFPEFKTNKVNIDSTLYDFQFMAMGVFLREYFFPDSKIMPDADRNWLLHHLNHADLSGVTENFKGYECILAGYLIALKASNINKCNIEFVLEKATKFNVDDKISYYGIIFSALFFIGLFESKANLYYFAASSENLFESIEKFSYELIHHEVFAPDFDLCYDEISNAILHPVPNAIRYYHLKNPLIKEMETLTLTEDFTDDNISGKVIVVKPEQSQQLINRYGNTFELMGRFNRNLTVTSDTHLYNLLLQRGMSVVLRNKSGLIEGKMRLTGKENVLVDSPSLRRWVKHFFPKVKLAEQPDEAHILPHWIIISENYQISETDKFLIQKLQYKPQTVTVFNFANQPVITVPETKKIYNKKKGVLESFLEREKDNGSNPILQSQLEKLFPECHVNVITKISSESPWEMVLLGIGALQEMSFNNCTFIDTRLYQSDYNAFEIILRCFNDVIVLDKDQRYLFMNLN